ncbi:MAG: hypothetical protein WA160_08905 [Pseudobdellovibrio sp.]
MKHCFNALIWSIVLTGSVSFAKVVIPNQSAVKSSALNEKALIEELTGKKEAATAASVEVQNKVKQANLRQAPLPVQHFYAGEKAAAAKNYILAIKHFNTVIKNYPLSTQVKPALLAKAKIYQEMGLKNQSEHNIKLAQLKTVKPVKINSALVKNQEKNKLTK